MPLSWIFFTKYPFAFLNYWPRPSVLVRLWFFNVKASLEIQLGFLFFHRSRLFTKLTLNLQFIYFTSKHYPINVRNNSNQQISYILLFSRGIMINKVSTERNSSIMLSKRDKWWQTHQKNPMKWCKYGFKIATGVDVGILSPRTKCALWRTLIQEPISYSGNRRMSRHNSWKKVCGIVDFTPSKPFQVWD